MAPRIPLLGVCLGHQCIGHTFGGKVVRADRIMHGKTSWIHHDGKGLYRDLANPFEATRYHSLVIQPDTLPAELEVVAWTDQDEIMGVRHRTYPLEGVQYHPESFLTLEGIKLLKNFISDEPVREPDHPRRAHHADRRRGARPGDGAGKAAGRGLLLAHRRPGLPAGRGHRGRRGSAAVRQGAGGRLRVADRRSAGGPAIRAGSGSARRSSPARRRRGRSAPARRP